MPYALPLLPLLYQSGSGHAADDEQRDIGVDLGEVSEYGPAAKRKGAPATNAGPQCFRLPNQRN